MEEKISGHLLYYYISEKAAYDPCRTIYVCAPGAEAGTVTAAAHFAAVSGWRDLAEERGAVLIVPVATDGWEREQTGLLMDIYRETRNQFRTRSGEAIWGRNGFLWCWESLLYLVGYEDGAEYAGNVLVSYPGMFAAAALVNGTPSDYSAAEEISGHWMVPSVGGQYSKKNRDIPVHLWMFGKDREAENQALSYFSSAYGDCEKRSVCVCGYVGQMTFSVANEACQMRLFGGNFRPEDIELNRTILLECFEHVVRWKSGPDGMLALMDNKEEFYENPRFLRRTVTLKGYEYDYFVHLPKGMEKEEARGLPLVFTVHGRGEPAYLFTTKNGWDTLADECREFVLVSPDSPGNIWFLQRDGEVFPKIVDAMAQEFGIDTSRVYLHGFSNGGMIVREAAVSYPHLFTGISPWNAPVGSTFAMMKEESAELVREYDEELAKILEAFLADGYEMPCAFIFGDQDGASRAEENLFLAPMLQANNCNQNPCLNAENMGIYAGEKGYAEGERFSTAFYQNEDGAVMVSVTVMKDMPHGAVKDESRATWAFLKRFCRPRGACRVEFLE